MTNPAIDLFNDRLPNKPYFSDDLALGLHIAPKERAILAKYIQFNQPHAMFWLCFDVDRSGAAIDWSERNAPAPTLTITNPGNAHAHLLYALKIAIRTAPDGSLDALKYAAAVENALRKKLGADTGYAGLICKNPNHSHWKVAVWQPELYTLGWLADFLDLNVVNDKEKEIVDDYGLGRNCTLFENTRTWAYSAIRQGWPDYRQWLDAVIQRVEVNNLAFPVPLPPQECIAIARSVTKWTHQRFSAASFAQHVADTHMPEIQAVRGRKGGTIGGKLSKRKPVDSSERTQKPWEALGIGQATYYRRKAEGYFKK